MEPPGCWPGAAGPKQPNANGDNCQPQGHMRPIHFPPDRPSRAPRDGVPLSPAPAAQRVPRPQLPTQNQGCPGHPAASGLSCGPWTAWRGARPSPAVSPGHLSPSAGCPPEPCPRWEPLTGLPCHAPRSLDAAGTQKSLLSQGFAPGSGPDLTRALSTGPHPRALSTRASPSPSSTPGAGLVARVSRGCGWLWWSGVHISQKEAAVGQPTAAFLSSLGSSHRESASPSSLERVPRRPGPGRAGSCPSW